MSEMVVYGNPASPFVRAVRVGFEEKGAPYRLQSLQPGEAKSEPYLKQHHPFGRMPAFAHGDFSLYETQAILRYLDDLYPEPAFEPSDPKAAARMNQIVGVNDWYLFPKVVGVVVFQRIVGPLVFGKPTDEKAIEEALPMARTCMAELDRLLGDQPFFAGAELSLADLMVAPQLDFFAATKEGKDLLQPTRLKPWLERMNARPSMQKTQRPEAFRGGA